MQREHQPEILIGSAPYTSFRTLLCPCKKGKRYQVEKMQEQERLYMQAHIKVYKRQLVMGRHFLHEHPVHASSWCMPEMRELLKDGRVHLVQGLICRWRTDSTDCGEQRYVRGKTRSVTSSPRLAALLAKEPAGQKNLLKEIVGCG